MNDRKSFKYLARHLHLLLPHFFGDKILVINIAIKHYNKSLSLEIVL